MLGKLGIGGNLLNLIMNIYQNPLTNLRVKYWKYSL